MELQIEKLIEKYWKGESTLEEERQLKAYFKANPMLSKESDYFRFLKKEQQVTFDHKKGRRGIRKTWFSVAATITIGIVTAIFVLQEANKDPFAVDDPQQALEETRRALMLIGAQLNEGQSYTMELTKINKAQEELKEDDGEPM